MVGFLGAGHMCHLLKFPTKNYTNCSLSKCNVHSFHNLNFESEYGRTTKTLESIIVLKLYVAE